MKQTSFPHNPWSTPPLLQLMFMYSRRWRCWPYLHSSHSSTPCISCDYSTTQGERELRLATRRPSQNMHTAPHCTQRCISALQLAATEGIRGFMRSPKYRDARCLMLCAVRECIAMYRAFGSTFQASDTPISVEGVSAISPNDTWSKRVFSLNHLKLFSIAKTAITCFDEKDLRWNDPNPRGSPRNQRFSESSHSSWVSRYPVCWLCVTPSIMELQAGWLDGASGRDAEASASATRWLRGGLDVPSSSSTRVDSSGELAARAEQRIPLFDVFVSSAAAAGEHRGPGWRAGSGRCLL